MFDIRAFYVAIVLHIAFDATQSALICDRRWNLKRTPTPLETDLDRIRSFPSLSWLSLSETGVLASLLAVDEFDSARVMVREGAFATMAHILLKGVARITCQTGRTERATIAFIAPGLIPEISSLLPTRFDFRCDSRSRSGARLAVRDGPRLEAAANQRGTGAGNANGIVHRSVEGWAAPSLYVRIGQAGFAV